MTEPAASPEATETPLETLERLARLARISIPEDRKQELADEFSAVRTYIGQLDELDIDLSGAPEAAALHNVLREDGAPYETGTWTQCIVAAFPAKAGTALSVKKIISHD